MLPDDHPSSFCKLIGLTSGKLCLVLEALDFVVKQGKNKNSYSFQSDAFNGFLQSSQLQSIEKIVSQPSILKHKRHWAKELMSNIRSVITKDLIYSLGKHSQR
jgi:hypothetical protein